MSLRERIAQLDSTVSFTAPASEERLNQAERELGIRLPPELRGFLAESYADLLGIPEIAKPSELAKRGGAWFENGAVKIHR